MGAVIVSCDRGGKPVQSTAACCAVFDKMNAAGDLSNWCTEIMPAFKKDCGAANAEGKFTAADTTYDELANGEPKCDFFYSFCSLLSRCVNFMRFLLPITQKALKSP